MRMLGSAMSMLRLEKAFSGRMRSMVTLLGFVKPAESATPESSRSSLMMQIAKLVDEDSQFR